MREPDTDTDTGAAAVPPTVLAAEMGDSALLLQSWRVGRSAHVCAADADPLREALAAVFRSDLVIAGRSAAVQAQP